MIRIGDSSGRLKEWFGRYPASIAVVRPDRFLAGLAIPQTLGSVCDSLAKALSAKPQMLEMSAANKVA